MSKKLSPKIPMKKINPGNIGYGAGVFIMFRTNMGAPAYVGRADSRLYDILSTFKSKPYNYVKILPCNKAEDAFLWECMFWHKGQKTIDNSKHRGGKHPPRPYGSSRTCPYPGCIHEFEGPAPIAEVALVETAPPVPEYTPPPAAEAAPEVEAVVEAPPVPAPAESFEDVIAAVEPPSSEVEAASSSVNEISLEDLDPPSPEPEP